MLRRICAVILCSVLWCGGTWWGYRHAIALREHAQHARIHAITQARDMQRMADLRQLRDCQMRVLESYDYQQTDLMIAQSALKHAGMER